MNDLDKILVIINPWGGNRKAGKTWAKKIEPIAKMKPNTEYEIVETAYSGHAFDLGRDFDSDKYVGIVFCSGDGLINEFINGYLNHHKDESGEPILLKTPFLHVPCGSQNGLCFGLGTAKTKEAAQCLLDNSVCPMDMYKVENSAGEVKYGVVGIGFGIPGAMVRDYEKYRRFGRKRYALLKVKHGAFKKKTYQADVTMELSPHYKHAGSTIGLSPCVVNCSCKQFSDPKEAANLESRVEIPTETATTSLSISEDGRFNAIGIINSNPEGPFAHVADGCLDVIVSRAGGCVPTCSLLAKYVCCGNQFNHSLMSYYKCKKITITPKNNSDLISTLNVDGEVFEGSGSFTITCMPRALKAFGH
eukprot:TRINITY_DN1810_c0_g2_i1.p1 TRINITY_DN1810_c0_g2~~TRINITY_DN1810_c0_g2_i1.p1  ORF type:complete len:361 (-),score=81.82 TRINITY_DN1810_c0_g2_i1:235-1317(-)